MKLGDKRQAGPKTVAAERKGPRAMKQVVLAYHEDEDGNQTVPAVVQTFRVVATEEKEILYIDRDLATHRWTAKKGELDWSTGAITVGMQYFDEDGELIQILHLSHDKQYAHNFKKSEYGKGEIRFMGYPARTPCAYIPRFNIVATGSKRAPILTLWQQMADSEEASWIDGRAPTQEELEEATKAREKAKADKARDKQVNSPQPAAIVDEEGLDDFTDV